jgi:hypothetical protein
MSRIGINHDVDNSLLNDNPGVNAKMILDIMRQIAYP